MGSVLGLVGPVSDLVRRKVGFAISISVWQHVNLSEQIRHLHVAGTSSNQQTLICSFCLTFAQVSVYV